MTDKKVEMFKIYNCGYCVNDLSKAYKGVVSKKEKFNATSVIIKHREEGYVLFDTGYSRRVFEKDLKMYLYRFFNPTFCEIEDEIKAHLIRDGVALDEVKNVVISHLHPDHIGGLHFFKNSRFIISKEINEKYKNNRLRNIIFDKLIPEAFEENKHVIRDKSDCWLNEYFTEVYDLFGDNSILLVKLDGHSNGQLGLYLSEYETFFVSDAFWKETLVDKKLTFKGRLIQEDANEFIKTIDKIKRFKREKNVKIISSHGGGIND
ncbi:MBL fold metallo-hydrolase [Wukongibacter baidiensis]